VIGAVIVNFNAGPLLVESVRAARASTEPVEVVVVDNGSTDGSVEALRAAVAGDPAVRIIEAGDNLGFARASNLGIRETSAAYVLLLNPDCVLSPDALAQARAALEAHPGAGMAGGLLLNEDGSEQEGCRRSVPRPGRAFLRAFGIARLLRRAGREGGDFVLSSQPLPPGPIEVDAISGAFMLVSRAALDRVGLLDEAYFLHCEDLDWCMRFRLAGLAVLFVPSARALHYKGTSSRGRPVRVLWHMHKGMLRYYRKFFRRDYPGPFMWLVAGGVALRFSALASIAAVRQARRRLLAR
jgi:GT2 family glycosyltransferase